MCGSACSGSERQGIRWVLAVGERARLLLYCHVLALLTIDTCEYCKLPCLDYPASACHSTVSGVICLQNSSHITSTPSLTLLALLIWAFVFIYDAHAPVCASCMQCGATSRQQQVAHAWRVGCCMRLRGPHPGVEATLRQSHASQLLALVLTGMYGAQPYVLPVSTKCHWCQWCGYYKPTATNTGWGLQLCLTSLTWAAGHLSTVAC